MRVKIEVKMVEDVEREGERERGRERVCVE
jgi:hypothetical protein